MAEQHVEPRPAGGARRASRAPRPRGGPSDHRAEVRRLLGRRRRQDRPGRRPRRRREARRQRRRRRGQRDGQDHRRPARARPAGVRARGRGSAAARARHAALDRRARRRWRSSRSPSKRAGFEAISFTGLPVGHPHQRSPLRRAHHRGPPVPHRGRARPRPHRDRRRLPGHELQRREITTLGRGGSDTTAVALAAALGAERCEIYSDVDGVYSADPRVVPDARHLPELDSRGPPGDGRVRREGRLRPGGRVGAALRRRRLRAVDLRYRPRRAGDGGAQVRAGLGAERRSRRARSSPRATSSSRGLTARLRLDEGPPARRASSGWAFRDLSFGARRRRVRDPAPQRARVAGARRKLAALLPSLELVEGSRRWASSATGSPRRRSRSRASSEVLGRAGIAPRFTVAGPLRLGALVDAADVAAAQRAAATRVRSSAAERGHAIDRRVLSLSRERDEPAQHATHTISRDASQAIAAPVRSTRPPPRGRRGRRPDARRRASGRRSTARGPAAPGARPRGRRARAAARPCGRLRRRGRRPPRAPPARGTSRRRRATRRGARRRRSRSSARRPPLRACSRRPRPRAAPPRTAARPASLRRRRGAARAAVLRPRS